MNWNIQDNRILFLLMAIAVCFLVAIVIKIVLRFVTARMKSISEKTSNHWDDIIISALAKTKAWIIFLWCVHLAYPFVNDTVNFSAPTGRALQVIVVLASALQVIIWSITLVRGWSVRFVERRAESNESATAAVGLLTTAIQACVIAVVLLLALSNLGVDIMALVAGLGVGGIAVALAAQNILGDLLASLSIVLDKPFLIGDFIVVDDKSGTVENIGIKTTRVRSISGEQVIFSNKDLLENRVQNFKRMWERRVVQKVGVVYSTPLDKLRAIPSWIQEFVENDPELKFDRCHLSGFGGSSLDFEFVFFVKSNEYKAFMDHQQTLLFSILDKFEKEGISIAFPSESVYIEKFPEIVTSRLESAGSP